MTDAQEHVIDTRTEGESRLRFTGTLMGEVSTFRRGDERWTEIRGWRTEAGRLIVQTVGRSTREGERDFVRAGVFGTEEEMMRKMGWSRLHARLWRRMGVEEIVVA